MELERALVSGSVRRQRSSSAFLTASSTARSSFSTRRMWARGTFPASSQRCWTDASCFLAASRSLTGRICLASASSCSLTVRLPAYSWSIRSFAAVRAEKNTSWAARNRAHKASSSLRDARGASFHRSMSSRYFPAVSPHSVDEDSASASLIRPSLTRLALALVSSREEKKALRCRSNVVRALRKRFHRASSSDLGRRPPERWWSCHCENSSAMRADECFHCVLAGSCAATSSAASTIAVRCASCCALAALASSRSRLTATLIASSSVSRRVERSVRSPTMVCASTCSRTWSTVLRMSPAGALAAMRCSSSTTCASASSNLRAKYASASSGVASGNCPHSYSVPCTLTYTVPFSSARPKARARSTDSAGASAAWVPSAGRGCAAAGAGAGAALGVGLGVDGAAGLGADAAEVAGPGTGRRSSDSGRSVTATTLSARPRRRCPQLRASRWGYQWWTPAILSSRAA